MCHHHIVVNIVVVVVVVNIVVVIVVVVVVVIIIAVVPYTAECLKSEPINLQELLRADFAYHSSTYVGTINTKIYTFLARLARG